MIKPDLLEVLRCPVTMQKLALADDSLVGKVNQAIGRGECQTVNGDTASRELEAGLIREDREVLYPIYEGIPMLVAGEGLRLPEGGNNSV